MSGPLRETILNFAGSSFWIFTNDSNSFFVTLPG
jgi:hypothetical protein